MSVAKYTLYLSQAGTAQRSGLIEPLHLQMKSFSHDLGSRQVCSLHELLEVLHFIVGYSCRNNRVLGDFFVFSFHAVSPALSECNAASLRSTVRIAPHLTTP